MTNFTLDKLLAADTIELGESALCKVLLMNDNRWPWLILVPKIASAVEIHDLDREDQTLLARETGHCAKALKAFTNCRKINSGALGNMVTQLHIHVIARHENDPNWPGPVWGYGTKTPYGDEEALKLADNLRNCLSGLLVSS